MWYEDSYVQLFNGYQSTLPNKEQEVLLLDHRGEVLKNKQEEHKPIGFIYPK